MSVSPPCRAATFALIVIDADDIMAHLSEANSGYKTDIARTDDSDLNLFWHSLMGALSFWEVSLDSRVFCLAFRVPSDEKLRTGVIWMFRRCPDRVRLEGMAPRMADDGPGTGTPHAPLGGLSTSGSETTLAEALTTLRKRKWVLILAVLLGFAIWLLEGFLSAPPL